MDERDKRLKLEIDPMKTMAFHSWSNNKRCNCLTASFYRKRILSEIKRGREWGINAYFADITTPFGLLALEVLVEERKRSGGIVICSYRTNHIRKRKTYRIMKEKSLDFLLLDVQADYHFEGTPAEALVDVLPKIAFHVSESGLCVLEKMLPQDTVDRLMRNSKSHRSSRF